jgi:hypothetical protein
MICVRQLTTCADLWHHARFHTRNVHMIMMSMLNTSNANLCLQQLLWRVAVMELLVNAAQLRCMFVLGTGVLHRKCLWRLGQRLQGPSVVRCDMPIKRRWLQMVQVISVIDSLQRASRYIAETMHSARDPIYLALLSTFAKARGPLSINCAVTMRSLTIDTSAHGQFSQ